MDAWEALKQNASDTVLMVVETQKMDHCDQPYVHLPSTISLLLYCCQSIWLHYFPSIIKDSNITQQITITNRWEHKLHPLTHLRSVSKHFSLIRHNRIVARASVLWRDINLLTDWLIEDNRHILTDKQTKAETQQILNFCNKSTNLWTETTRAYNVGSTLLSTTATSASSFQS